MARHRRRLPAVAALMILTCLGAAELPARAAQPSPAPGAVASHFGRSALARRRVSGPALPPGLLGSAPPATDFGTLPPGAPQPFNLDPSGLPENEESVTSCPSRPEVVLGAEHDYRGLTTVGTPFGFGGWQISLDGGASVANEGVLPGVVVGGQVVPADSDPVVAAAPDCSLYYGMLNLPPDAETPSAVTVYRSTPETLAACPSRTDASCWPARRIVASSASPQISQDKPWIDVGRSGAEVVVWVAWTEFRQVGPGPDDFTSSIRAARCDNDLSECTAPMLISGRATDVQFADVTIAPGGRTMLTWTEFHTDRNGAETLVHKLRIAPVGSTRFGPTRTVAVERRPIADNGFLHADDFRVGTYPKNTVATVNGRPRIFVTWDACRAVVDPLIHTCEEPRIRLRYSDDDGQTWTEAPAVSAGGDNYFPTIDADPDTGSLAIAYYTNRADPYHHRQQVELVTVDAATAAVVRRQTLSPLNEPDADPHLQGSFIGDYFEVSADHGRALVHFNANYRFQKFLGTGVPVPQQDNYLVVAPL